MKKFVLSVSCLLLLSFTSLAQTPAAAISSEKESDVDKVGTKDATLVSVIDLINKSLKIAEKDLASLKLTLSQAEITLVTSSERAAGGGIKIFAKASGKWSKEAASTVTYKFITPKSTAAEKANMITSTKFANAILASAQSYKDAHEVMGLVKDGFEHELSFTIKAEKNVGVELELFGLAEIEAGADFNKTVSHTAKLTFKDLTKPFFALGSTKTKK